MFVIGLYMVDMVSTTSMFSIDHRLTDLSNEA